MGVRSSVCRALALGTALGLGLAAGWFNAPALAASPLEKNGYLIGPRFDSNLPACDSWWALSVIKRRFASKEYRFWNSNLQIDDFAQVKEVAYRPWMDGTIPRRFCAGRALISDGKWRTVRYSIIEDGGMISASWGVHWCVVGIDRNWANNPECQEAGP